MARRVLAVTFLVTAMAGGCISLSMPGSADPDRALLETVRKTGARAPQILGVLVDGLYLKALGHSADAAARASFVAHLQTGGSVEQVIIALVTLPDHTQSAVDDRAFLQSLYRRLLGRDAQDFESAPLLESIASVGRGRVAEVILKSAEFRLAVVRQLYGLPTPSPLAAAFPNLLHRMIPPPAEELSGWANGDLDLLGIEFGITMSAAAAPQA